MTNDEQDRLADQAKSIGERYYKKVENFTGEQAWRDWSFQFKATTRIERWEETTRNKYEGNEDSFWEIMAEIAKQSIKRFAVTVNG